MLINRTLYLNPVEPEYLAFRFSSGIETKIDFHFKGQNGAPWREDVVAQLQMTARSDNQTEYLSVPSIDVVNGVARVVIPAGLNYDPNGWRLRLTGTVDTEPRVIAYGVATAVGGAGPQVEPQDVIDQIDLTFERDEDVNLDVTLWQDYGKSAPFDLLGTGTTASAYVFDAQGGTVLMPFAVNVIAANVVNLTLSADQVNTLPAACWWTLVVSTSAGITTLCEGDVTISGVATPPFADVIANYTYLKQDTLAAPVAGQIIHSNYALDILRVHFFDQDSIDRSVTLTALRVGYQIQVGVTTWAITSINKAGDDWYEFHIAPAVQAAVTGVQPFTFHRV